MSDTFAMLKNVMERNGRFQFKTETDYLKSVQDYWLAIAKSLLVRMRVTPNRPYVALPMKPMQHEAFATGEGTVKLGRLFKTLLEREQETAETGDERFINKSLMNEQADAFVVVYERDVLSTFRCPEWFLDKSDAEMQPMMMWDGGYAFVKRFSFSWYVLLHEAPNKRRIDTSAVWRVDTRENAAALAYKIAVATKREEMPQGRWNYPADLPIGKLFA